MKDIYSALQHLNLVWNANADQLIADSLASGVCKLTPSGSLTVNTGQFTGRSPKDKFIVKDAQTADTVWWSDVNQPFSTEHFNALLTQMLLFLRNLAPKTTLYVRDAMACAHPSYRLKLRVITQTAWANLFAHNLFLRPTTQEIASFEPEWTLLCLPEFLANPARDHTRQGNFTLIDFTQKIILIGGSAYTGEIKKSIFTVLNYLLPQQHNVLPMHCSANTSMDGKDTAIFFGLSGTGKTTLSSDVSRRLVGDDEHGWCEDGVFNFEGGCYAKVIDLSKEKEPQIYNAIRKGALLENIGDFYADGSPDYKSQRITENTRVSYPIEHIDNAVIPSLGGHPKHIFFLTCDAFGVLPPLSKLSITQAMYYFILGYTAKVAGTETGITEPVATFSACFGRAFLPLHPEKYAHLLGKKLSEHETEIWLVNTGWTGGAYGVGQRMSLPYTRALINAVLKGKLLKATFEKLPIFNLAFPTACDGVPTAILNPKNTWVDAKAYDAQALKLAKLFTENFAPYQTTANIEIVKAAPIIV